MGKIKAFVQYMVGLARCVMGGVRYPGKVYVGRHVHFVNGKNIRLGKGVKIRPDVDLFAAERFSIGAECDIGTRNRIAENIVIENNVLIGPDNYICSVDHCYQNVDVPVMYQGAYNPNRNGHKELKIGEGSWIGTHTAIIGDVHIGKNCVVGANSVVLKDIPDGCVVAGNPTKIIKKWNAAEGKWEHYSNQRNCASGI